MSIGTPIDRAGSGDLRVTGRDRTEGNLTMDIGGGRAETVLSNVEEAEHNTD